MEKNKIKIVGMKKFFSRCEFAFEKNWEVVGIIDDILDKLYTFNSSSDGLKYAMNSNGEPGPKVEIGEFADEIYVLGNDEYVVDVFIGKEKIIMVIHCDGDRQGNISDAVFEFADFEEDLNNKYEVNDDGS